MKLLLRVSVLLILAGVMATPLHAATRSWLATAGSTDFNDVANWSGGFATGNTMNISVAAANYPVFAGMPAGVTSFAGLNLATTTASSLTVNSGTLNLGTPVSCKPEKPAWRRHP